MLKVEKAYCDYNGILSSIDWSYTSANGGQITGTHTCRLPAGTTPIEEITMGDVYQILETQLTNTAQEMEDYLQSQTPVIMNSRLEEEVPHLSS